MEKQDNDLILMLGGNIGDTEKKFTTAIQLLTNEVGVINQRSSVYISEPWGFTNQDQFLNQALWIKTALSPEMVLQQTKQIEKQLGKNTLIANGPRTLDIDLMFYNQIIYNALDLFIPHPRLHLRNFNLIPLNEIIPMFNHPVLNQTISEITRTCKDQSEVTLYN